MLESEIIGIHHLALKCNGIDEYNKTVDFYSKVLGLPVTRAWGEGENSGIMLDTGAGMLEIFANADEMPTVGAVRHFAFNVNNTDLCVEAVRNAGYEISVEPNDVEIPSNPTYPARIAFCIGPIGEEIEFFEVK